jgi:predicted nucleotide-binding protein (sugar kinase/HSP70/actin superfamily)
MDIMTMLPETLILIAILAISTFMCKYIYEKWQETKFGIKNDKAQKAVETVINAVYYAVNCVNQTMVDALKKEKKFDAEAAKKAFSAARSTVLNMLSKEVIDIVTGTVGDFNTYLDTIIESTVKEQKQ